MTNTRKLTGLVALIVTSVLVLAATVLASGDERVAPGDRPSPVTAGSCREVEGELDLGATFRGTAVQRGRLCLPSQAPALQSSPGPQPLRLPINARVAAYGTCKSAAADDAGCMPTIQIQTWSSCERNYALYAKALGPDGTMIPHERTRIRGVDAAIFDEGRRIEMYGRDVTVVVFAPDSDTAVDAAKRVRGEVGGRLVHENDSLPGGPSASCGD